MPLPDVLPDTFLHVLDRAAGGGFRKQRMMNICGRKPRRLPDDDSIAFFVPLEYRAWTYAQSLADFRRNGDLTLCRQLRVRERHDF
jgi:hypothetical protein